MVRFTKRPVTIDAVLASTLLDESSSGGFSSEPLRVPQWVVDAFTRCVIGFEMNGGVEAVLVNTHHGQARAEREDWIIRGVDGELYPCKADVFARTYEPELQPSPIVHGKLWEVYRCDQAAPNEACGIRESGEGILTLIVSDTNREECCHHMQLADAIHIVRLHNDYLLGTSGIIRIKGDVTPEQFKTLKEKWDREVSPLASRAPILDAEKAAVKSGWVQVKDQPPPRKRDDLRPAWEEVVADYRERFSDKIECRYPDDPTAVFNTRVVHDVLDDMRARDATGRERYGVPLTAFNGRDQLVDAYQEILDFAVYLRAAMDEGISIPSLIYNDTLNHLTFLRRMITERALSKAP